MGSPELLIRGNVLHEEAWVLIVIVGLHLCSKYQTNEMWFEVKEGEQEDQDTSKRQCYFSYTADCGV